MKKFVRKMALVPKGLRYKLLIAFSLMSIIPLLVCVYLVNSFIFPQLENIGQVSVVVLFSIGVAFMGLILAKRLVDPIIDMALEAKIIASGHYERLIKTDSEDEIGELGKSINAISKQIKGYMNELHSYSLRTKDMNVEIQKKILALSSLLQIGDMIATSEDMENILALVVEKVSDVFHDSASAIYLLKEDDTDKFEFRAAHNEGKRDLETVSVELGKGYLGKSIRAKIITTIDGTTKISRDLEGVQNKFQSKNCLILPIVVRQKVTAFLFNGSETAKFRYREDDIELIKVLAKQVGIAIENNLLLKRAEEVAFKDDLTGLHNESFLKTRLDEEIRRAIVCQRPCSFLMFNIDDFNAHREAYGEMATEEMLKKMANLLKENSTEISKIARLGGDEFAVVLPEKNKKEAYMIAKDICEKAAKGLGKISGKGAKPVTVSGGVSENPIDGASAEELFKKAADALKQAKETGKNKVVA